RLYGSKDALRQQIAALQSLRNIHGEKHPEVARALRKLAAAQFKNGDKAGAEQSYEQALALTRELFGDANQNTLDCVSDFSFFYRMQGLTQQSLALWREYLSSADQVYGPANHIRLIYMDELAGWQAKQGDVSAAEQTYRAALEMM